MGVLSDHMREYPIFEVFDITGADWKATQLNRALRKHLSNATISPVIPIERVFEQIILKNAECLHTLRECASWSAPVICGVRDDETMPVQRVFTRQNELVIVFGNYPYEGYNGTVCVTFKYKRLI